MAQVSRHSLLSALSKEQSHLAKYFLFVFPSNTHTLQFPREPPPNTHGRFLFIAVVPCGIPMTLLAGHPHPSGSMPSQKPLKQSPRDRGLSTYKATYWIQVQTKRARPDLSSLGAYLYSKKPNRLKQTSKLKKQQ